MFKIIRKFSLIMLLNLLVFLSIWHILDLNLWTNARYKILFLVLSVISLIFLSKNFLKKDLEKMQNDIILENNNKIKNESTK